MPLYEYKCPECDVRFERLRPMTDGRQADCPDCETQAPRVLSLFATFSRSADGQVASLGGGCACAAGGACACASGF
ncbi:MAG: zinc ribbon domain-containing protein [Chloroflexi bacterium]|nr:zinc ribbon domain-containing protein [Chloroflexota bacterium]